jgi:hypothetical protein
VSERANSAFFAEIRSSSTLNLAPPSGNSQQPSIFLKMADSSSAPMYVEGPRTFVTTDQDHGGVALVICTLMATWSVLCWIVRVYMRATVSAPFGVDDLVCTIATVC